MHRLKRINLKFSEAQMENEYHSVMNQDIVKKFRVILSVMIIATLITAIERMLRGRFVSSATPWAAIAVFITIFCLQMFFRRKYTEQLTLISILIYTIYALIAITVEYSVLTKPTMFFGGYTYTAVHTIMISRISNLYYKIFGVAVGLCLRFVLLVGIIDNNAFQTGTLIRNILIDGFLVYYFYFSEKTQRKVFKKFYESREELLKFKELLADSLPQGVLVIDCISQKICFSNKAFASAFCQQNQTATDFTTHDSPLMTKSGLELLFVDQNTLREKNAIHLNRRFYGLSSTSQPLNQVIQEILKTGLLNEKTLSLTASYSCAEENKSFEVILKRVKWDNADAVAIILNDITYQENIIALRMANINKDKVIATVSHELRTPLHGIIGLIAMTEKEVRQPKALEYLSLSKDNAHLLLSLVNSILDYQQLNTGNLKLVLSKTRISKIINDVIQLFQFQVREKQIYLTPQIQEDLPLDVTTDENRLKQILINLVGNAIKFTKTGGITIQVAQDIEEIDSLSISVRDTGIGIKEEDKPKLFKMYGRLEDREGVNKNGVGLGLTISNALAVILNGTRKQTGIEVASQHGVGSKFYFKILKDMNVVSMMENQEARKNVLQPITSKKGQDVQDKPIISPLMPSCVIHENNEEELYKETTLNDLEVGETPLVNLEQKMQHYASSVRKVRTLDQYTNRRSSRMILNDGSFDGAEERMQTNEEKLMDSSLNNKDSRSSLTKRISMSNKDKNGLQGCILVVDDNPFNLLVAGELIKEIGYGVKTALGGLEAIEFIKNNNKNGQVIKAILMDCQMPMMDGYETTKVLDAMMKTNEIKRIPILAWTANDSEEDIKRCFDSGMVGYITKPASREALVQALSKLHVK